MNDPFSNPRTRSGSPAGYAAAISRPISATRRAICSSEKTIRSIRRPPVLAAVSGVFGIRHCDQDVRLLRVGRRDCGPGVPRDPEDRPPRVGEYGNPTPFLPPHFPFPEQLLELLGPVRQTDPIPGVPPSQGEGEGEVAETEGGAVLWRRSAPDVPANIVTPAADHRLGPPRDRRGDDDRPIFVRLVLIRRRSPNPDAIEVPLNAGSARDADPGTAGSEISKLDRDPGSPSARGRAELAQDTS